MKLVNFQHAAGKPQFGVVIDETVVSFKAAMTALGSISPELASMETYLANLPRSHELAKDVVSGVNISEKIAHFSMAEVRFLPPIPNPPALLDVGLSPRHLKNSALTLIKRESGRFAHAVLGPYIKRRFNKMLNSSDMPYCKCNHNAIIGDGDTMGWPKYTSYLDVEAELGIVFGTKEQPIAGYLIYNDVSARDVQMPEFRAGGGPARCKDFDNGQGIGPFLVTADEVPDPLALKVTVKIGDRFVWNGHTREYKDHPRDVVRHLQSVFTPLPGTIIGMGTVPDCCGLDNDEWLWPGDAVEISFSGLGTLHQQVPAAPADLEKSRWKARPELNNAHLRGVTDSELDCPMSDFSHQILIAPNEK